MDFDFACGCSCGRSFGPWHLVWLGDDGRENSDWFRVGDVLAGDFRFGIDRLNNVGRV